MTSPSPKAHACHPSGRHSRLRDIAFSLCVSITLWAEIALGGQGRFEGELRIESVDTSFETAVRLMENFAYRDSKGKVWQAERDQVFDGAGFPPLFRDVIGSPLESAHPKSGIVYEAMTQKMRDNWEGSRRMFLEAAIAEGVEPVEAKVMYFLLGVQGSRWETPDSRCFGSCHVPGKPLYWRPVVKEPRVVRLVDWVRKTNPPIEDIDRAIAPAIRVMGPHIVTQPDCSAVTSVLTRFRLNCD